MARASKLQRRTCSLVCCLDLCCAISFPRQACPYLVSRCHTLSKTGEGLVCLASTTRARGMSGMFGLRNTLHNKLRLLTCYTKHDVTAPALTKGLLHYNLFTFSWPQFESGSLRNGGMLAIRIFAGSMMSRKYCATSESLHMFYWVFAARRSCLLPAVLAMLWRGKRPNTTAKIIIYNVYQYFQETAKSKYRGALR